MRLNKDSGGVTFLLGLNKVLRIIMMHRRLSVVILIVTTEFYKSLHQDGISALNQDRETAKINRRATRISQLKRMSTSQHSLVSGFQKDIKVENENDMDRYIYDVIPDDEDIENIFIFDEVGDDSRYTSILQNIENLDFNIFELKTISMGNELVLIANHLMEINEFYRKLNISKDKFRKYSVIIQKMYNPVSYHNKTHAADVTQTSYYFLTYCDFYNIGQMSDMEACVLLISGMVHDTDHPGVNNLYLVATRDKLALRYNDKSVLENHHISCAFNIMLKSKETCIYENFTNEQFKQYREFMIDLVLATDNVNHNAFIVELKKREASQDFDPKVKDKKLVMSVIIHLADISNPTKPWRLCYKWIDLLFLEFFKQGDKERDRGLPISFLMDRATTNIAKAQGGFIDHFIKPAYDLLEFVMPNIALNMKFLQSNKQQWALLEESYNIINDPKINFRGEDDIIDESEFNVTESESSMDIIQKDLHWRKQSIMIAHKRGTIVGKGPLISNRLSGIDGSIDHMIMSSGLLKGVTSNSSTLNQIAE